MNRHSLFAGLPVLALSLGLLMTLPVASPARAEPLPASAVPEPLKSWVPWVMHGHEMLACPLQAQEASDQRVCVWPSKLMLDAGSKGATFRLEVQVFGPAGWVELPGEPGSWPQDVKLNDRPLAVVDRDDVPVARVAPGIHVITGSMRWAETPQDLRLPLQTGSVTMNWNGRPVSRAPDAEGRILLQRQSAEAAESDALTVRTVRLVDDTIPLRVTTHIELAVAGKPREVTLPAALLPGFVPESLAGQLPARLAKDSGELRVQVRPGNWTLEVGSRLMSPVKALTLPERPQEGGEEVWSFVAHPELRTVTLEGLNAVDPRQLAMPEAWRVHPAYQVKPGQTLKLVEVRRGDPQPAADKLSLSRSIWLDFDGGGYTLNDRVSGTLSRSWRLEAQAPLALGRASVDGTGQTITRRQGASGDGIELRRGALALDADSRIDSSTRTLPAAGWLADFDEASAELNLPPGWTLLHASGVDRADGSWVSQWTLWDFFFVLLSALAAAKLIGPRKAAVLAAALVLTWHMDGAPQALWLALLGLLALVRVLPAGRLLDTARVTARVCAGVLVLVILPYAVHQVRLSLYPTLEFPGLSMNDASGQDGAGMANTATRRMATAPQPADVSAPVVAAVPERMREKSSTWNGYSIPERESKYELQQVDPNAKVQTGPGLPAWRWRQHQLSWQGPLLRSQSLGLVLMPPAATVALRLVGLALMVAAMALIIGSLPGGGFGLRRWSRSERGAAVPAAASSSAVATVAALVPTLALGAALLLTAPAPAHATQPQAPNPGPAAVESSGAEGPSATPGSALLDQLRGKLTVPPDCLPQCASVARLWVQAQGAKVQLRLELHALADVAIPLPGQGANWRPTQVLVDGKPAPVRRDDTGALWLAARAGVSQVLLSADVGDASTVEIALPMPAQDVSTQVEGWTLAGLDARGLTSGALSLSRTAASAGGLSDSADTERKSMPPFVQVERVLRLGLHWTVETRVTRLVDNRAPVRVRIRLLEGEAVNNDVVKVEGGVAELQLGAEESASFSSTLKEQSQLKLQSAGEPQQIEVWTLEPGTQWHVGWTGIAPVQHVANGLLQPQWRPWPGESVELALSRPAGVAGQVLTLDRMSLHFSPGLRATDVTALAELRSSQGGNRVVQLPEGVEFLGVEVDGRAQPLQPQGRQLLIPVTPGAHKVQLRWREPRGMVWRFDTTPFGFGAAGVNGRTELAVPPDRVVLAVGGPVVGPAVLLWGVCLVWLAVAWKLGRTRITPLGGVAWFLLGLGLIPTSLGGAVVVVGWFFVLAARERCLAGERAAESLPPASADAAAQPVGTAARPVWRRSSLVFNAGQVLLVLWTLVAALVLLNAVRVGLLGYPDMMVTGNGSHSGLLRWYQDRFAEQSAGAWVVSVPVLGYRLLMLLWALWLAASLLKWVKWGWQGFSGGGYWRGVRGVKAAASPKPEVVAQEGGTGRGGAAPPA